MVERLAEDHTNARTLAEGLASFPQIRVDLESVQSNIVYFELHDERVSPAEFAQELRERGVLVGSPYGPRMRAVAHYGVEGSDIEEALEAVRAVLAP
jgi:threonine aldolase